MKKAVLLMLVFVSILACKDEKTTTSDLTDDNSSSIEENAKTSYPEAIGKVFEAHGGMERWNEMNNLCFEMEGRGGKEVHTTSLKDRMSKIEAVSWTIGYDGSDVWLLQNKEDAYTGNARFYHNLMFYFYAMPFVVGDEGIKYEQVPATELDGVVYPGIRISYEDGVGDSPDDEYIVYYEESSNQMVWLGYTVTYRSQEKSDDWHYIKYTEWQDVNGLLLPKKLSWYEAEEGKPTSKRNAVIFSKVTMTETILDSSVFEKPEAAVIVKQ